MTTPRLWGVRDWTQPGFRACQDSTPPASCTPSLHLQFWKFDQTAALWQRRLRTSPKWQATLKRTRSPATIDRLLRDLMSNYSHVLLWASHQWLKLFPHTEIARPVIQASGHWAILLVTYFVTGLSGKRKIRCLRGKGYKYPIASCPLFLFSKAAHCGQTFLWT